MSFSEIRKFLIKMQSDEALNIDNIPLSPIHGTTLFDVLVVHKELFLGLD